MKSYLKEIWRTKSFYIESLLTLLALCVARYIFEWHLPTEGDLGLGTGFITALVLTMGPIIYVKGRGLKVQKPKPRFVEPRLWIITIGYLVAIALAGLTLVATLSATPYADFVFDSADKDSFIGTAALSFICLFAFLVPMTIYMLFISLRYKKIVEYNTPEWKRLMTK